MKVLICGSRDWTDAKLMYKAMHKLKGPAPHEDGLGSDFAENGDTVIEGEANGADIMSRIICDLRDIPVVKMPADWCDFNAPCQKQHVHNGKKAGVLRNQQMIDETPDEVWAFSDDLVNDRGTASTVRLAQKNSIIVRVFSHGSPTGAVRASL